MRQSAGKIIKSAGIVTVGIVFLLLSLSWINPNKVSMRMEAKSLIKGKAMVINAEIYYQYDQGNMITRYLSPLDYLFITNQKGEAKVYYPKTNEVFIKQSAEFDSEKSLLYFFLSNKMNDLGLKEMGFTITDTRFEENLVITTWFPPATLMKIYGKVELVHENYKPIYIAYFDRNGKVMRKIFYYEYSSFPQFSLPTKVVEFNYLAPGDSTINKITYSNILVGDKANSPYFKFKIPVNAKVKD
ncbi:MAG: hypothetical protein AB9842_01975 [Bacteroidales bacterium]